MSGKYFQVDYVVPGFLFDRTRSEHVMADRVEFNNWPFTVSGHYEDRGASAVFYNEGSEIVYAVRANSVRVKQTYPLHPALVSGPICPGGPFEVKE